MIETLDIRGFKSIREIHLDCKRVNLFIGQPNTGKSNILEALGFLSSCGWGGDLRDYVRFGTAQNLFYDGMFEPGSWSLKITGSPAIEMTCSYADSQYAFSARGTQVMQLAHDGRWRGNSVSELKPIRFYRVRDFKNLTAPDLDGLHPPDGRNLAALVYASKELRQLAGSFFSPYGLRLVIKPQEHQLEVQKQVDDVVVAFPFDMASDTLQRMVFYTVAIDSNKDAVLVFEEPEAHAFPYFTKHLGERIALDENKNQYFIATHNPYLLAAVVEKAPAADVAVFATYYRDYETRVRLLTAEELSRLFEADPFLGIDQFIEAGQ